MAYGHLTDHDRQTIATLLTEGYSPAAIGRHLHRHRSTICREIVRNRNPDGGYWREKAHRRAQARRRISTRNRRYDDGVWNEIEALLGEKWSPEQIAGSLRSRGAIKLCHKTIYRHIKWDRRRGGTLFLNLRGSSKRHRKRYGVYDRRGRAPDKRSIDERPARINDRSTLGHWEGDTVVGPVGTHPCLLTLVERKTGYLIVKKLHSRSAAAVNAAILETFKGNAHWMRSLTVDNGTEFHDFKTVEHELGTKVYFCHPHHSWERGTNENTNGLLRQYIPKGVPMKPLTQHWCDTTATALNVRPRKRLCYQSPAHVFPLTL